MATPRDWASAQLVLQGPQVSPQAAQVVPALLLWLQVLEEHAKQVKFVFRREILARIERSRKRLLSHRRGRRFDPPSVSGRLPAAELLAILFRPA